jgi:CRISPR-associated protein Cas1
MIPYEHKKGHSHQGQTGPDAWPPDILQAQGYGLLARESLGAKVREVRIRYHEDNVLVKIPLNASAEKQLRNAISKAQMLRRELARPPITSNERWATYCWMRIFHRLQRLIGGQPS